MICKFSWLLLCLLWHGKKTNQVINLFRIPLWLQYCICLCPGELFTLAVLDREREVEYNMVAKATDGGGRSCQADILLMIQDMNDNPPRFSSSHYEVTVFDNTTVRTPVAVIYAKDPDTGRLSFFLMSLWELQHTTTIESIILFLSGQNMLWQPLSPAISNP